MDLGISGAHMMIQFEKTPEQLEREDIVRQALEEAAKRVETKAVGFNYAKAFRAAARYIRSLKP